MHGFMQHTTRLTSLVLASIMIAGCASTTNLPPTNQQPKKEMETSKAVADVIQSIILKGLIR